MTGRKICTIAACADHVDDPAWEHVAKPRRTTPTAHLRPLRRVA